VTRGRGVARSMRHGATKNSAAFGVGKGMATRRHLDDVVARSTMKIQSHQRHGPDAPTENDG
jgi:hypothetical protein